MENVMYNEDTKRNMHIVSKIVYIFGKIMTIFCYIGLAFIILGLIVIPVVLGHVDTKNSKFKVGGKEYTYKIKDKKLTVYDGSKEIVSEKFDVSFDLEEVISKHPSSYYVGVAETIFTFGAVSLIISILFLKRLTKLFKNICEDETPFTEENIINLRKMALYLGIGLCFSFVGNFIFAQVANLDARFNFNASDILIILIILCASYVFSYGLKLEKPKKSVNKK